MIADYANKRLVYTPPHTASRSLCAACVKAGMTLIYGPNPDGIHDHHYMTRDCEFEEGWTTYLVIRHPLPRVLGLWFHLCEYSAYMGYGSYSFAEYVDLESTLSSWSTFHRAMAKLYRPITKKHGEKYQIAEYNPSPEMEELMKFAPLDVCIAASLFFWNLGNELLPATLSYLEKEIKKNPEILTILAKQLNLQNDGDGIRVYMHSLKEMLQNSMMLPSSDLLNASRFSRLKSKKTKLNKDNLID